MIHKIWDNNSISLAFPIPLMQCLSSEYLIGALSSVTSALNAYLSKIRGELDDLITQIANLDKIALEGIERWLSQLVNLNYSTGSIAAFLPSISLSIGNLLPDFKLRLPTLQWEFDLIGIALGALKALIDLLVSFGNIFLSVVVGAYAYIGPLNLFGTELQAFVNSGQATQFQNVSDTAFAVIFMCDSKAAWNALQVLLPILLRFN